MMPITISQATADDRDLLIELYHNLLGYLDQFEHEILPTRHNAEWMVDHLFLPAAERGEPVLIARDGDTVVGSIFWVIQNFPYQLRWKTAMGYGTYILPEWRRQKVGQSLRKKAIEILRAKGIEVLFGMVHYANRESVAASDRFGFKPYSRLDRYNLE